MRKELIVLVVLTVIGLALGFGSLIVSFQDFGSCPADMPHCDHAYYINGGYIWMRPLYTELDVASLIFLASALIIGVLLKFRPVV